MSAFHRTSPPAPRTVDPGRVGFRQSSLSALCVLGGASIRSRRSLYRPTCVQLLSQFPQPIRPPASPRGCQAADTVAPSPPVLLARCLQAAPAGVSAPTWPGVDSTGILGPFLRLGTPLPTAISHPHRHLVSAQLVPSPRKLVPQYLSTQSLSARSHSPGEQLHSALEPSHGGALGIAPCTPSLSVSDPLIPLTLWSPVTPLHAPPTVLPCPPSA